MKKTIKCSGVLPAIFLLFFCRYCIAETESSTSKRVNYVELLNKLNKAGRDESLNAAPYYQKAFELYVDMPKDFNISDLKVWPEELPEKKFKAIKEWILANNAALEQLKIGSQKSSYWIEHKESSIISIEFPGLIKFRDLAYALGFMAKLKAMKGDFKNSFSDLIVCYRIGNHLSGPKTSIEQLVGIAIKSFSEITTFEILAKSEPGEQMIKNFQSELENICIKSRVVFDFTAEKLTIYDNIQGMFTDDGKGDGYLTDEQLQKDDIEQMEDLLGAEFSESEEQKYKDLKRNETLNLAEKLYSYIEEICSKTPGQLNNENKQPEKAIEQMIKDNFLLQLLTPAYSRILATAWREKTHTTALLTTLAIFRYKAEKGYFPEKISQLVSGGYLKELPIDAYSNKPLIYRKVSDNFILYSIGADFDDDGGIGDIRGQDKADGDIVYWPVK